MEDFLDWSYDSLLSAESSRRLKTLPTLEFEVFGSVFDNEEGDDESSSQDNAYLAGVAWWKQKHKTEFIKLLGIVYVYT